MHHATFALAAKTGGITRQKSFIAEKNLNFPTESEVNSGSFAKKKPKTRQIIKTKMQKAVFIKKFLILFFILNPYSLFLKIAITIPAIIKISPNSKFISMSGNSIPLSIKKFSFPLS